MYVHKFLPLAYLAHPRTASRATKEALGQRGFILQGPHHGGPPNHGLNGRRAFCVVRNHWDAIASWYYNFENGSGAPMTANWIRTWTAQNATYFSPGRMWWFTYLHPEPIILRYESLQESLDALLGEYGIKPIRLPVVGASSGRKGRHYRELHTEQTSAAVRSLWGDEIDRLGYVY